jgi:hypothetical protein
MTMRMRWMRTSVPLGESPDQRLVANARDLYADEKAHFEGGRPSLNCQWFLQWRVRTLRIWEHP